MITRGGSNYQANPPGAIPSSCRASALDMRRLEMEEGAIRRMALMGTGRGADTGTGTGTGRMAPHPRTVSRSGCGTACGGGNNYQATPAGGFLFRPNGAGHRARCNLRVVEELVKMLTRARQHQSSCSTALCSIRHHAAPCSMQHLAPCSSRHNAAQSYLSLKCVYFLCIRIYVCLRVCR